jgi:hypothetical protein
MRQILGHLRIASLDTGVANRRFWAFGYLYAAIAGATIAGIFALMAGLGGGIALMLMAGAALLLSGLLFTVLEILRLGRGSQ